MFACGCCTISCVKLSTINKILINWLHEAVSFLRSSNVLRYSKNSLHFMEPEGSSPYSQQPATWPCPEPDWSSPCLHPSSRRSILILSSFLRLGLPSGLIPTGFPTKALCAPLLSPIRATRPAHLILLDLITRMIQGGSNMTGTNCDLFTHNQSRSYLNHLVFGEV